MRVKFSVYKWKVKIEKVACGNSRLYYISMEQFCEWDRFISIILYFGKNTTIFYEHVIQVDNILCHAAYAPIHRIALSVC